MSLEKPLRLLARSARKIGLSISRFPPPYSHAKQIREYLQQMRINCVLDVGGYIGSFAHDLREGGFAGKIISFEPVPETFEKLRAKMGADPLWVGQPFGLSDSTGKVTINSYGSADFNSVLDLKESSAEAYGVDVSQARKVEIELRRLDEVLTDLIAGIAEPRIFLKMDTQGHDLSVFAGAKGILNHILGLQSELPAVPLYDEVTPMWKCLEAYSAEGYVPIGFHSVNSFGDTFITPEFDVIFHRYDGQLTHLRPDQRE